MLLDPVNNKAIGRKKAQNGAVINGLEGPNPGIKLLFWQLSLQDAKALVPERRFSRQAIPPKAPQSNAELSIKNRQQKDGAVYTENRAFTSIY